MPTAPDWQAFSTTTGTRPTASDADLAAARAEALAPLERSGGENPYTVHAEVQQTMSDLVGIIRKEDEIKSALAELEKLRARAANLRSELLSDELARANVVSERMVLPGTMLVMIFTLLIGFPAVSRMMQ